MLADLFSRASGFCEVPCRVIRINPGFSIFQQASSQWYLRIPLSSVIITTRGKYALTVPALAAANLMIFVAPGKALLDFAESFWGYTPDIIIVSSTGRGFIPATGMGVLRNCHLFEVDNRV